MATLILNRTCMLVNQPTLMIEYVCVAVLELKHGLRVPP